MTGNTNKGERLFTSKQVERIIGERLAREKRNSASLAEVRDMMMNLVTAGVLHSRNIPDMAAEVEELLTSAARGRAVDNADNTGENASSVTGAEGGTKPDDGYEDASEELSSKAPAEVTSDDSADSSAESSADGELSEFTRVFPGVDLRSLLENEEFLDYADGKAGSLVSLYAAFLTERDERIIAEEQDRSNSLRRSLASTGFSSGKSAGEDYSSLLTPTQMRIAKAAGMTYKEYADYLSQIKTNDSQNI